MKKISFFLMLAVFAGVINAQSKKPLDHSVYDSWQSIGERMISNDGKWIVYTINPQEGDNVLVIRSADGTYTKSFPRGYGAVITEDSRYTIFKVRPHFKDNREARIKKKRPDEMPKDSICIVEMGKETEWKKPRIKSFKTPEKEAGWVAYHLDKPIERKETDRARGNSDKKLADSLNRIIDSLHALIEKLPKKKGRNKDEEVSAEYFSMLNYEDADGDEPAIPAADAGTDLVVREISSGKEQIITNVLEYYFSKKGKKLIIEQARNPKDSTTKNSVLLYNLQDGKTTTLSRGGNEFKSFVFSEDGEQLAYLGERDAKPKELQKYFKVWYFKTGMDSATILADKNSPGMQLGNTISEYGNINFSKNGNRLFFGTAPIMPPKDTSMIDIDLVKLDVWHYKDDYLQTQQLFRLQRDLQTNYTAVYMLDKKVLQQLATREIPTVYASAEGDGNSVIGITDFGRRVESQWAGNTKKDIYIIDMETGEKKLVRKDMLGNVNPQYISPSGKYVMWYDSKLRHYFAWDGDSVRNITARIRLPLYDEENDSPADPPAYGIMGWEKDEKAVFIYDRYGIWNVDPAGKNKPVQVLDGRATKMSYRYVRVDRDERSIDLSKKLLFKTFNNNNKYAGIVTLNGSAAAFTGPVPVIPSEGVGIGPVVRSQNNNAYIFTKENYVQTGDLYVAGEGTEAKRLSSINPQQSEYNWGTAELYKWKAFNGKQSEGVLYKPENFDSTRKYPLLLYFYETHSNTLYDYIDPSPTGSRINISFFVSRGYIVFSPDIHYTNGKPAKSAYDYVVSAAKDLSKKRWIDAANIGIQGQSWGGIQVAQLITMTDMFKAAWAGAPVANMTSAYGGIRWESGANRQFQYEKTQSRIGATLWEKPELYIENSPLFHLPKVKTPLVIMSNDADGAVPWYQGIELFTAMRRLGKQVWMLNYNGEAHNLVERKNKKDIQVREQQYFDWLLKGAKPPRWIVEGIPAVKKGKDWALDIVE